MDLRDEKVEVWGDKGIRPRPHGQVAAKPACLQNHGTCASLNRAAVAHLPGQGHPMSDGAGPPPSYSQMQRHGLISEDFSGEKPAART